VIGFLWKDCFAAFSLNLSAFMLSINKTVHWNRLMSGAIGMGGTLEGAVGMLIMGATGSKCGSVWVGQAQPGGRGILWEVTFLGLKRVIWRREEMRWVVRRDCS